MQRACRSGLGRHGRSVWADRLGRVGRSGGMIRASAMVWGHGADSLRIWTLAGFLGGLGGRLACRATASRSSRCGRRGGCGGCGAVWCGLLIGRTIRTGCLLGAAGRHLRLAARTSATLAGGAGRCISGRCISGRCSSDRRGWCKRRCARRHRLYCWQRACGSRSDSRRVLLTLHGLGGFALPGALARRLACCFAGGLIIGCAGGRGAREAVGQGRRFAWDRG